MTMLLLAGSVPPALAQDAAGRGTACLTLADPDERLACYDRALGRIAEAPSGGPRPSVQRPAPTHSLIDAAWSFEPGSDEYSIKLHRANYLLFGRYSDRVNDGPYKELFEQFEPGADGFDSVESKFQISIKARIWGSESRRLGAWVTYTQQNQWQTFNDELSSPFRETNYMPEVLLSYRPEVELGGFHWRLLNVGYNHQSNGRSDPISRSWDRLVAEFGVERDDFALLLKTWYRIPESKAEDDNPDITDYYGHAEATALYHWREHTFSVMGRGSFDTGKGAIQATWMSPRLFGALRAYVQVFSGYGESMIDYDWHQNTVGVGFSLNEVL